MSNLDDKVHVSAVGTITGVERLHDGRVKYTVRGADGVQCFVFEENLITIYKGERDVVTNKG